jgi:hypothetical protein
MPLSVSLTESFFFKLVQAVSVKDNNLGLACFFLCVDLYSIYIAFLTISSLENEGGTRMRKYKNLGPTYVDHPREGLQFQLKYLRI